MAAIRNLIPMLVLFLMPRLGLPGQTGGEEFAAALEAAARDAGRPLAIDVQCAEDSGRRSFRLYPSGVLVWNGHSQARIGVEERAGLLNALRDAGFAQFDSRYGGVAKGAAAEAAPIMVLCRIDVTVGNARKSSYQDVNGERSERFMALAGALLDQVAPLGEAGITADSLERGVEQLAAGELAPEVLRLQLMRLPADRSVAGTILEVDDAILRRRDYHPGVQLGDPASRPLTSTDLQVLTGALERADLSSLPDNLIAKESYQLRLEILQHQRVIRVRPLGQVSEADTQSETARFLRLAEALLALR